MYGKIFSSTFTGSMFGAGPDVFALWSYVVANSISSTIELNPLLLAATLGMPPDRVELAIKVLESPDPKSRNPKHDGRRLVHEGAFQYHVTSHTIYRNMRDEDGRRQYQRNWVKNKRANPVDAKVDKSRHVDTVDTRLRSSTQSESEAESEAEAEARVRGRSDPERVPPQARDPEPRKPIHLGAATPAFLSVLEAYPNQNAKQRAAQEFQELATQHGGEERFAIRLLSLFKRGFLKRHPYNGEPRYVPTLATMLAERRFEEKWSPPSMSNGVPPEIPDLPPGVPPPRAA